MRPSFRTKFASVHQISLKSCDSFLIYSDKIIFKMAAIRHLKFLKFGIVVTWPVSEVILLLRTKFSVNRTINHSDVVQKRFFNVAAVRHFEFAKF